MVRQKTIVLNNYFSDADGDTLTFSVTSSVDGKVVTVIDNGVLTITPVVDANGDTSLKIIAADAFTSIQYGIQVTITPINDEPSFSISDEGYTLSENETQTILIASDVDIATNNDILRFTMDPEIPFVQFESPNIIISPEYGTVEPDNPHTFTSTVTLTDRAGAFVTQQLKITVHDSNQVPVITPISDVIPDSIILVPGTDLAIPLNQYIADLDGSDQLLPIEIYFGNISPETKIPSSDYTINSANILSVSLPDDLNAEHFGGTSPIQIILVVTDNQGGKVEHTIDITIQVEPEKHDYTPVFSPSDTEDYFEVPTLSSTLTALKVDFAANATFTQSVEYIEDVRGFVSDEANFDTFAGQKINFVPGGLNIVVNTDQNVCPCDVTLSYNNLNGIAEDDLVIWHYVNGVWEKLPTTLHDTDANTITGTTQSFSPFALGASISIESDNNNGSGSSNEWKTKPTFGKSWEVSSVQLVEDGFIFNDNVLDITDNWHTDFTKTSSIIGDTNTVSMKAYAPKGFKYVTLSLGVPQIGDKSHAETNIVVHLQRNYTNPVDYDITKIIHEQKESLLDENKTTASVSKSMCSSTDNTPNCYTFNIDFVIMAPLKDDVVAISAVDTKNRSITTYINDGVVFTGESLLDSATHQFMQKKTNQGPSETIHLTQQDRRYQIWEDQHGYLWTQNDYGTWFQMTYADESLRKDKSTTVMTRMHSDFAQLMQYENQRATLTWDASAIQSIPGEIFVYDYTNVNTSASKLDNMSGQLKIEEDKAQTILDIITDK